MTSRLPARSAGAAVVGGAAASPSYQRVAGAAAALALVASGRANFASPAGERAGAEGVQSEESLALFGHRRRHRRHRHARRSHRRSQRSSRRSSKAKDEIDPLVLAYGLQAMQRKPAAQPAAAAAAQARAPQVAETGGSPASAPAATSSPATARTVVPASFDVPDSEAPAKTGGSELGSPRVPTTNFARTPVPTVKLPVLTPVRTPKNGNPKLSSSGSTPDPRATEVQNVLRVMDGTEDARGPVACSASVLTEILEPGHREYCMPRCDVVFEWQDRVLRMRAQTMPSLHAYLVDLAHVNEASRVPVYPQFSEQQRRELANKIRGLAPPPGLPMSGDALIRLMALREAKLALAADPAGLPATHRTAFAFLLAAATVPAEVALAHTINQLASGLLMRLGWDTGANMLECVKGLVTLSGAPSADPLAPFTALSPDLQELHMFKDVAPDLTNPILRVYVEQPTLGAPSAEPDADGAAGTAAADEANAGATAGPAAAPVRRVRVDMRDALESDQLPAEILLETGPRAPDDGSAPPEAAAAAAAVVRGRFRLQPELVTISGEPVFALYVRVGDY